MEYLAKYVLSIDLYIPPTTNNPSILHCPLQPLGPPRRTANSTPQPPPRIRNPLVHPLDLQLLAQRRLHKRFRGLPLGDSTREDTWTVVLRLQRNIHLSGSKCKSATGCAVGLLANEI